MTMTPWLCTLLLVAPLAAQATTKPSAFYPVDYNAEIMVDMKLAIDTEAWDVVERSPLRMLLTSFRRSFGFDFAELDRFRMIVKNRDERDRASRQQTILVFEGSDKVTFQTLLDDVSQPYEKTKIAGLAAAVGPDQTYVQLKPGTLVAGWPEWMEATLNGERKPGGPNPDLLAMTAGQRSLAYLAGIVPEWQRSEARMDPIPADWLDPDDPITHLAIHLVHDDESDRVGMAFRVRFEDGDVGPRRFGEHLDEFLKQVETDPELRMFKGMWEDAKVTTGKTELTGRLDFGPTAAALGSLVKIGMLLAPVGMATEGQAPMPPEPKPPGKPKDKKNKGGGP